MRQKSWKRIVLAASVGLFLLVLVGWIVSHYVLDDQLNRVRRELDASDPGWRLNDLVAAHNATVAPDAENITWTNVRAKRLIPASLSAWLAANNEWLPKEFNHLPSPTILAEARRLRTESRAALDLARTARRMTRGGSVMIVSADPWGTLLQHIQDQRDLANLLGLSAVVAAADRDFSQAMIDSELLLHCAIGLDSEPTAISFLVKQAILSLALNALERTLALGEVRDEDLADWSRALARVDVQKWLLIAIRSERAFLDASCEHLSKNPTLARTAYSIRVPIWGYVSSSWIVPAHVKGLQTLTRAIEMAQLPPPQWNEELLEINATMIPVLKLVLPATGTFFDVAVRNLGKIRVMQVAIACERFRLKTGHWPQTLRELVPEFLPEVPLDPCDGQPLRFVTHDDGVTIYSVGPDRIDNGGSPLAARTGRFDAGQDIGVRLWSPLARGRVVAMPEPTPKSD